MNDLKTKLTEEVLEEIKALKDVTIGDEVYKEAVNGIAKLSDKVIELERIEVEARLKNEAQILETTFREEEAKLKREEAKTEKKDKKTKNILTCVNVVGGFAVLVWGALNTWHYEEKGTIGSKMGNMFINSFRLK